MHCCMLALQACMGMPLRGEISCCPALFYKVQAQPPLQPGLTSAWLLLSAECSEQRCSSTTTVLSHQLKQVGTLQSWQVHFFQAVPQACLRCTSAVWQLNLQGGVPTSKTNATLTGRSVEVLLPSSSISFTA